MLSATALDTLTTCYFAMLPVATLFSHVFMNGLTRHGYIATGISKNNYKHMYMYGLLMFIRLSPGNTYIIHLGRRLIETQVFRYSERSKMSVLQLMHGVVYYLVMCLHLRDKCIRHKHVFVLLNVLQSISHYFVFVRKCFIYSHYLLEAAIYLALFWDIGTVQLFLNFLYVLSFVFSSIRNRRSAQMQKLVGEVCAEACN